MHIFSSYLNLFLRLFISNTETIKIHISEISDHLSEKDITVLRTSMPLSMHKRIYA